MIVVWMEVATALEEFRKNMHNIHMQKLLKVMLTLQTQT